MKRLVELPIKIDASVVSECWTFVRMAILETSEHARAWIATHMQIILKNGYYITFGSGIEPYGQQYFDGMLHREEISVADVSLQNCVGVFTKEIAKGNYIVTYLTHPTLFSHEVLLYGYNLDKKVFYSTKLKAGRFIRSELPFQVMEEEYRKLRYYYQLHSNGIISTLPLFHPITKIKLKQDYRDDMSLYSALQKLSSEINGTKYESFDFDENKTITDSKLYYSGLACLIGMEDHIHQFFVDKQFIKGNIFKDLSYKLTHSLLTMYEHRTMLVITLEYIYDMLDRTPESLKNMLQQYKSCWRTMHQIYLLAYKFEKSENWSVLQHLQEVLSKQYLQERKILSRFHDMAYDRYCDKIKFTK